VAQLQKMAGLLGTARDTHEMREKMHETQEQTRRLVRETNDAVKRLGQFDGGSAAEARERRMQQVPISSIGGKKGPELPIPPTPPPQDKLGKDFKAVLQKFQSCSQVAVSKERDTVAQQRSHGGAAGAHDDHVRVRGLCGCVWEE
jgi:hypothetical protein